MSHKLIEIHPQMHVRKVIDVTSLFDRRHLGILILDNIINSANHDFILTNMSSSKVSSQSAPQTQMSCINIFPLMTYGDSIPSGSNNVAIFLRKFLLVNLHSFSMH